MGNVPVLKPAEVVAILRQLGFVEVRQTSFPQAIP
jgi:predicted RNA binding protein YcfA (HicA-like mRNA interferase family)